MLSAVLVLGALVACGGEIGTGGEIGSGGEVGQTGAVGQIGEAGDVATWALSQDFLADPNTTYLVVDVTRLDCASGVTGTVLEPMVRYTPERVEIRTDVEALGGGAADCQGNDAVPLEVTLTQPLGMRELVDVACSGTEAGGTSFCQTPLRWAPPAGLERVDGVPDWQEPSSYSFTVQSSCGEQAFIGEYAVTVTSAEVTAVEPLREGWAEIQPASVPTIADMLELARQAESSGAAEVWVDSEGVPRWLNLDPMPQAIDDENCFLITDFRTG